MFHVKHCIYYYQSQVQKYKKIIAPINGKILEVFAERFGMKAGTKIIKDAKIRYCKLLFHVKHLHLLFFFDSHYLLVRFRFVLISAIVQYAVNKDAFNFFEECYVEISGVFTDSFDGNENIAM